MDVNKNILVRNQDMRVDEIARGYLYHGTLKKNVRLIRKYGLVPMTGDVVFALYGNRDDMKDYVFAANDTRSGIMKMGMVMINQLGIYLNIGSYNIEDIDRKFYELCAVVVVKKDLFKYHGRSRNEPLEYGDYYSEHNISVVDVLEGDRMMVLFDKYSLTPSKMQDMMLG